MKKIQLILITLFVIQSSYAQPQRVITTGVPFLLIAADARSAGMADQGVATSPDAYSQQYNPAKYAFSIDKQGFSASYTPYLSDLVNDINLGQVTYYNKINEKSAFAVGLRYFGFGGIETRKTGDVDEVPIIVTPNEFAIDGSYSLKLSERFSTSVAGRFIRSQLKIATEEIDARPATTFAFDVAGYYQSEEIAFNDFNGRWRWGFNFQNLGPKINYEAQTSSELGANFLPSQMRLGTGFDFIFEDQELCKDYIFTKDTNQQTCLFDLFDGYASHKNYWCFELIQEYFNYDQIHEKNIENMTTEILIKQV